MNAWVRHHLHSLRGSLGQLARSPFTTLLNVLVIGIVLALPVAGAIALDNLRQLSARLAGDAQISVFLALDAAGADIERVQSRIRASPSAGEVRFIPRDDALAALKRSDALAESIGLLKANPLPDAFAVTLARRDPAEAAALVEALRTDPKVAHVQHDAVWLARLDRFLALGRLALALFGTLLGVALIAVTFNTIRSQIAARRDEIELARLVGATDGYIRRPFAYLGAFTALLGGVVAWALITLGVAALQPDALALAELYGSDFRLSGLAPLLGLGVTAAAAVLGLIGAWIAVSMHLHRMSV